MDISYILNELGEERENYFNAVSPPIIQTSNFAFKKVNDLRVLLEKFFTNCGVDAEHPVFKTLSSSENFHRLLIRNRLRSDIRFRE